MFNFSFFVFKADISLNKISLIFFEKVFLSLRKSLRRILKRTYFSANTQIKKIFF